MGAEVEAVTERPALLLQSHPFSSPINKLSWLRRRIQRRHEEQLKSKLTGRDFDTLLVVKGDSLDIGFFDYLRTAQPDADFILYQWDSIELVRNFPELRKRFNRCLTFDRMDAASDDTLEFRPLFFSRQATTPEGSPGGIVFVGSLHSKRLKLLRLIKSHAEAQDLLVRIYIRVGLFNFIRLLFSGSLADVHFRPLAYETYIAWTKQAEAVIDFPHSLQNGLTIRTIEAIGLGKKIITTNKDVVNYAFYDPKNVCLVDEDDPVIPSNFLNGTPAYYDGNVIRYFSLQQWILDVLDLNRDSEGHDEKASVP
jgi:hypothetical protein